ncbi:hypothetical protein [Parafrankia sp. EUN1f]|uniref:hypothetical protein n=1 Tax=Parafrankia sp. EUN1f TaxID=102897 RepID=UPI0001C452A9|nr:hypothetical protein [Parafrankia sp. EUN1f]EFC79076.1 hypothetical protein FrEUN1fDRAFT_7801 [Parafrankia sp. EUN1f]
MASFWDEVRDGDPCIRVPPHDIPAPRPDWAQWSERLAAADDPPPPGMRPIGRHPAWRAAARLRLAIALAVVFGPLLWQLGGLLR